MNRSISFRGAFAVRALMFALAAPFSLCGAETTPPADAFGARIDPAGDCTFSSADGRLTISVPGSEEPHDLAAELSSMSAPLVVREASGDFVAQVRVDGTFDPGGESTQSVHSGYAGAGLAVLANDRNYASIQRATMQWKGKKPVPYTNFELRVDGRLERLGDTDDFEVDPGKPMWLRLERKGDQLLGAMSQDGKHWTYGKPKELKDPAWNRKDLVVGMVAVSTSRHAFTPVFSGFALTQPKGTTPEKLPDTVQVADSGSRDLDSEAPVAPDLPKPAILPPSQQTSPETLPPTGQDPAENDATTPSTPAGAGPQLAMAKPGDTFQMLDGIRAVIRGWAAGEGVFVTVSYRDASVDGSPQRVLRFVPVDESGLWRFQVPVYDSKHLRMTFRAVDRKAQTSEPVTVTAKRKPKKE
jgi:regulation of enolase protein 1 (concanavalin A-like superfamily)